MDPADDTRGFVHAASGPLSERLQLAAGAICASLTFVSFSCSAGSDPHEDEADADAAGRHTRSTGAQTIAARFMSPPSMNARRRA
jgi:hypothetical protein